MSLSFLNPWFWLGLCALAAPVWLHLRRKRETNLQNFSALRFLEDQPEPRRSPFRLRDLLLLILRALALLALIGAFAWPYLRKGDQAVIRESRVYILDKTFSRQARDGFLHDRDRVLSEVTSAGREIQVAVVELTMQPRVVVSFGDDRQLAAQKLKDLTPSYQRGSYLAAVQQAGNLLANSMGARKRILFYGDNQANQWSENQNSPPFLHQPVELINAVSDNEANLSLSEPRAQRIFLGDKSLVNFTMVLTHTGKAKTATVILKSQGQVIFNRPVELEKQPEVIQLQAQWEADPKDWIRGEATVEGEPDALAGDNRLHFCLAPLVEGRVAVLAQSTYLRLALSPDIMRGQWAARILEPSALAAELAGGTDDDVLCIESNYLQSADARKLLARYLGEGRGVLLLVNRVTPAVASALRELGFEPENTDPVADAAPETVQYVAGNHPIFHPFYSSDYGNLSEIKILRHAKLRATGAVPLMVSDKGTVLFYQAAKMRGKLFVCAFGLDRDQTSWPVHQTFIPFLDLALQTARAEDPTPTNFEPGEVASIPLPTGSKVREMVLRDEQNIVSRTTVSQARAMLSMPAKPGLYKLSYDNSTQIEKVFSINPPPKESQLTYASGQEIVKSWQMVESDVAVKPVEPAGRGAVTLASIWRQQLWWWLAAAALLGLLLEMILAETKRNLE